MINITNNDATKQQYAAFNVPYVGGARIITSAGPCDTLPVTVIAISDIYYRKGLQFAFKNTSNSNNANNIISDSIRVKLGKLSWLA